MLNVLKTLTNGILEKVKTFKSDWNENDPSSPNYVKNRTHWVESEEKTIYVLNNYSFGAYDDDGGIWWAYLSYDCKSNPEIGEIYTVIFDGVKYQCKCKDLNMASYDVAGPSEPILIIGNLGLINMGADTGEPFVFGSKYNSYIDIGTATEGEHTLTIYRHGVFEKVHKLDEKFLPDMSQYAKVEETLTWDEAYNTFLTSQTQADWNVTNTGHRGYIKNKPTIYTDIIRYTASQSLTDAEKQTARDNIGATDGTGLVKYNASQSLTTSQKEQARTNIGASDFSGDYQDLNNRPCYHDISTTKKYWNLALTTGMQLGDFYYWEYSNSYGIVDKKKYKVVVNYKTTEGTVDTEYYTVCSTQIEAGTFYSVDIIGNAAIALQANRIQEHESYPVVDTGEDWCLITYVRTALTEMLSTKKNTSIKYIYDVEETIKPLDPKFLPDDHINNLIDDKLGVIMNATY